MVAPWHALHIPKWREEKTDKKNVVAVQKILISLRGGIIRQVSFLERMQGIFGENSITAV